MTCAQAILSRLIAVSSNFAGWMEKGGPSLSQHFIRVEGRLEEVNVSSPLAPFKPELRAPRFDRVTIVCSVRLLSGSALLAARLDGLGLQRSLNF